MERRRSRRPRTHLKSEKTDDSPRYFCVKSGGAPRQKKVPKEPIEVSYACASLPSWIHIALRPIVDPWDKGLLSKLFNSSLIHEIWTSASMIFCPSLFKKAKMAYPPFRRWFDWRNLKADPSNFLILLRSCCSLTLNSPCSLLSFAI